MLPKSEFKLVFLYLITVTFVSLFHLISHTTEHSSHFNTGIAAGHKSREVGLKQFDDFIHSHIFIGIAFARRTEKDLDHLRLVAHLLVCFIMMHRSEEHTSELQSP